MTATKHVHEWTAPGQADPGYCIACGELRMTAPSTAGAAPWREKARQLLNIPAGNMNDSGFAFVRDVRLLFDGVADALAAAYTEGLDAAATQLRAWTEERSATHTRYHPLAVDLERQARAIRARGEEASRG